MDELSIKSHNGIQKSNRANTFNIIKEGWDKLSLEFDKIVKNVRIFNESLDEENKKKFNSLIISLEKFKDDFKNVIFNISLSLGNISSNRQHTNNSINLNLGIKNSYDNIYNEFLELETLIKSTSNEQIKMKKKRNNNFQNLEKKLQGYLEDINNFDFEKIAQNYDKFTENKNNLTLEYSNEIDKINLLLQKNVVPEKYDPLEYSSHINSENFDEAEYDMENNNKVNEYENGKNNLEYTEEKEIGLLKEIVNIDWENKDDAINYIQSKIKKRK